MKHMIGDLHSNDTLGTDEMSSDMSSEAIPNCISSRVLHTYYAC